MKKLLLSMALLLCVGSALGQTADKLMKKYKGMKGVRYENVTKQIANLKEEDVPQMIQVEEDVNVKMEE